MSEAPAQQSYTPDAQQRRAIAAQHGEFLVLAPPGCGKTFVLAQRVAYAYAHGVPYDEMLCMTFTNHAARTMRERIAHTLSGDDNKQLFVGSVHRYCAQFIREAHLLPQRTAIIDDDDAVSILCECNNVDEEKVINKPSLRRQYLQTTHLAAFMKQITLCQDKKLRLHSDALTGQDIRAVDTICRHYNLVLSPHTLSRIYQHAEAIDNAYRAHTPRSSDYAAVKDTLTRFTQAYRYQQYKEKFNLIDFHDLLILTYDTLVHDIPTAEKPPRYRRYRWVQVDEVQDLNPIQLEIIRLLLAAKDYTIMYLGDDRQAIFSFMGATQSSLAALRAQCAGNIFHLAINHRAPRQLLEMHNTFAHTMLAFPAELLAQSHDGATPVDVSLTLMPCPTVEAEVAAVAHLAQQLASRDGAATTAVLVLTNKDADKISAQMDEMGVEHFNVSGIDLFAIPEVKLLLAHLSVFANDHDSLAWAQLLHGLHLCEPYSSARAFVKLLDDYALTPLDLMFRPQSSYLMAFAQAYETREIVIFDTETTGLNIFDDDIIQIAAVKLRGGELVAGSAFSVYITTPRPIPTMLGDIVNPIIEERKHHELLAPATALQRFMDYVGTDILLGHNAAYDYAILAANLRRYLPSRDLRTQVPVYYDTLTLARSLFPSQRHFSLKALIEDFHLEGENSHLADADVAATVSLVRHCYSHCAEVIAKQRELLATAYVCSMAEIIRERFLPMYRATHSRLHRRQTPDGEILIGDEMQRLYTYLVKEGIIRGVKNIEYVFKYIAYKMIDPHTDYDLHTQITQHILELLTLNETNLCASGIIKEKVFVTTVHKAKGLEFDNVIIFDANDDRYPNARNADNELALEEDKRKFYVALTRARQRLILAMSDVMYDYHNRCIKRQATRFLKPIEHFFAVRRSPCATQQ